MAESLLTERELLRLLDVGRRLVAERELEAVLNHVIEAARELTGARYAALGVLDEEKRELERFLNVGIDEETRRMIGGLPRGRGVLGELIRDPKPLRLANVTSHPHSYGFPPDHPPMRTFLGVPILIGGEAYGNLYLTDKRSGEEFGPADEETVVVLAEWAAIAIVNARLNDRLERRRDELERAVRGLEATAVVARAVGGEVDLDRVLELIAKRGRALVGARSVLVLLGEHSGLEVVAAAGHAQWALGVSLPVDGTAAGTALRTGEAERIDDLRAAGGHGLGPLTAGARSALVAPLGFRGRARGVLLALDREDAARPRFEDEDEYMLGSFAASASIAIATAQSVEAEALRRSLEAAESERGRWARELHDETLQALGAIKLALESGLGGSEERLRGAAAAAREQVGETIAGLQALIAELRPASLDELGVGPAVTALVERMSAISGLRIDAELDLGGGRPDSRLEPELESTVYRLVQEALNNAVKHSGAEHAFVRVVQRDGSVDVTVEDDGHGFDPERAGGGFGLIGMRERVGLVGGTLAVVSAPGAGTSVQATLPARS